MTSLYGASDEYHQAFVPNRNPAVSDWVADSLGALVGASIFRAGRPPSRFALWRARRSLGEGGTRGSAPTTSVRDA